MQELSYSVFELNGAGNEGPAILSLGLMQEMWDVTFRANEFFCEAGKFSAQEPKARLC